jgi:arylsulfatase
MTFFFRSKHYTLVSWLLILLLSSAASSPELPSKASKRPNIILIMADDMGFSDIGCYGGEIRTPNLDRLGRKGLRFTQFYNAARCCPSRASLLTGQYPHKAGIGEMVEQGTYAGHLLPTTLTIAEALKGAGYQTYMSGKWHVGEDSLYWPRQRGFDEYYGLVSGASSFYELDEGRTFLENNTRIKLGKDFYATRAYTDKALQFIDKGHASGSPYLLYLAYTAPHWPLHAPEADIQKYLGSYTKGWDQVRKERYGKLVKEGIISSKWPQSVRDSMVTAWEAEPRKEHWDRRMAVYAAMISIMDEGIGKIIRKLEQQGELENTVIFFLADNGGCAEVPHIYNKKLKEGMTEEQLSGKVGNETSYVGYENRWAHASNTPFRMYKSHIHEGGIASPLIIHWPAVIKKARLVPNVTHIMDIMPTCMDMAGATYSASNKGNPLQTLDGKSWLPLITNNPWKGHSELIWEHFGSRGIRQEKWKLVAEKNAPWELYDMENDRTETRNLAATNPQKVADLVKLYEQKAREAGVVNP